MNEFNLIPSYIILIKFIYSFIFPFNKSLFNSLLKSLSEVYAFI